MIDINLLRKDRGGNPDLVKESQKKRGASVELVDEVIAIDETWIKTQFQYEETNKKINAVQKSITAKMKAKEDASELVKEKVQLEKEREQAKKRAEELVEERDAKLVRIGNIVHSSVVNSIDEANNDIIRTHFVDGKEPVHRPDFLSHDEVLSRIEGYEPERGSNVAGHRGYYLRNWGVLFNQALINYGLAFLRQKNYNLVQTPFFMKKQIMAKTAQLEEFDEALYKVVGGDEEDKYLIATSEQPISALHMNEWLVEDQLPYRYAGLSTCFRKEAGAHGRDNWGIFRVHQFEKVEQFVLTRPENSWEEFDRMIANSEEFYQSLGLSYRIVGIVSGALNNAAAKKFDLEAWFPKIGAYKELVSCSNCTDYQSRRLEIRCGGKKMGDREKKYVHCLNSTLTATERTICALLENYQTETGVVVPEKLRPYIGVDFIPYTAEAPKRKDEKPAPKTKSVEEGVKNLTV